MSVRQATLYTCDYETCRKQQTVGKIDGCDSPIPSNWVTIESVRGTNAHGDYMEAEGLTFCGTEHSSAWFRAMQNPPVEAESIVRAS